MPPVPGVDQDNVVIVQDVLQGKVEVGDNIVLVDAGDAHWPSSSTVEYLVVLYKISF